MGMTRSERYAVDYSSDELSRMIAEKIEHEVEVSGYDDGDRFYQLADMVEAYVQRTQAALYSMRNEVAFQRSRAEMRRGLEAKDAFTKKHG